MEGPKRSPEQQPTPQETEGAEELARKQRDGILRTEGAVKKALEEGLDAPAGTPPKPEEKPEKKGWAKEQMDKFYGKTKE